MAGVVDKLTNASKPEKHHIKTFNLCDSTTRWTLIFLIYCDSETSYADDVVDLGWCDSEKSTIYLAIGTILPITWYNFLKCSPTGTLCQTENIYSLRK